MIYGQTNPEIKNFFGLYGSKVSDFLLQSFGLISFLILITLISWGIKLMVKKELKNFFRKIFYLNLYLIFGCTFVHITFNNSFWLIDNGNSGFVGELMFSYLNNYAPIIENKYISFILIAFTVLFFFLSSDINFKKVYNFIFSNTNKKVSSETILSENNITSDTEINKLSEPQQSFLFTSEKLKTKDKVTKFRLIYDNNCSGSKAYKKLAEEFIAQRNNVGSAA